MRFIAVFKQYKLLFFISFLAILILALMATIIYLNSRGNFINTPGKTVINYAGYDTLQQQINSAALDSSINQSPHFAKFQSMIQLSTDGSKSEKDRYTIILQGQTELLYLYTFGANHKATVLMDALSAFAKSNFPKEYKAANFSYPCEDPSCADSPPSQSYSDIINELKNSDFPAPVKSDTAQYLQSLSYYKQSDSLTKTQLVLQTASVIRSYSTMTQTGANVKIADDLYNFAKTGYPADFATLAKSKSASIRSLFKPEDLPNK